MNDKLFLCCDSITFDMDGKILTILLKEMIEGEKKYDSFNLTLGDLHISVSKDGEPPKANKSKPTTITNTNANVPDDVDLVTIPYKIGNASTKLTKNEREMLEQFMTEHGDNVWGLIGKIDSKKVGNSVNITVYPNQEWAVNKPPPYSVFNHLKNCVDNESLLQYIIHHTHINIDHLREDSLIESMLIYAAYIRYVNI